MTTLLDPEAVEIEVLLGFTGGLAGKHVLEIGSGDGRLTWRFAPMADFVVGLEPKPEKLARAKNDFPAKLKGKVEFHNLNLDEFAAGWRAAPLPKPFDLAILSWSL